MRHETSTTVRGTRHMPLGPIPAIHRNRRQCCVCYTQHKFADVALMYGVIQFGARMS